MNTITQNFKKFEDWLKENWIDGYNALNPPATDTEIQELKDVLGFDIHRDLEELLRCHNGQKGSVSGLFDELIFSSTKEIIKNYLSLLKERKFIDKKIDSDKEIQDIYFYKGWVPFTSDKYNVIGHFNCIDTNPTIEGKKNQLIVCATNYPKRQIITNSLSEWFCEYIKDIYDGNYLYDEDCEAILWKKDEYILNKNLGCNGE